MSTRLEYGKTYIRGEIEFNTESFRRWRCQLSANERFFARCAAQRLDTFIRINDELTSCSLLCAWTKCFY